MLRSRPMLDPFSAALRAARRRRGRAARRRGGTARDVDRPARPGLLRARGRHRRLPRARAGRRARFPADARRRRDGGRSSRSSSRSCSRRDRERYDTAHRARARRRARGRRHPRPRRLRLAGERRAAALRHAAARSTPADQRLALAASAAVLAGDRRARAALAGDRLRPAAARAPRGCARAAPDALLLVLVALAAVATLSILGALLATALLVVPAATTRLRLPAPASRGSWRRSRSCSSRGSPACGCRWSSTRRPAPTIAVLAGGVFALTRWAVLARPPRRPALAAAAIGALALLAAGCGGGSAAGARAVAVVATHDAARRLRARGRRRRGRGHRRSCSPTPTRTTTSRARATSGDTAERRRRAPERRRASTAGWATSSKSAGGVAAIVDSARAGRSRSRARAPGREASRYDPHWWHDPRNVEYAVGRIRDALRSANPDARAASTRATPPPTCARLRALDRGIRRCLRRGAGARAQARHRPRRVRLLRAPLRHRGRRRGHPLADDAGPALGGRRRAADATIRARGRQGRLPRELGQPASSPRPSRARPGARSDLTLYGDTLGPAGSRGATYLGMELANADAMVRGFTGGARGCTIPGP